MGVPEHHFFEEAFGVDLAGVVQLGLLFGETDIEQVLLEVAYEFKVELALVAV